MINEIFGEDYTGKEKIEFRPNEHFLDQRDDANQERITDTNFTIWCIGSRPPNLTHEGYGKLNLQQTFEALRI